MKYIIITTSNDTRVPIIFPEFMETADIAVAIATLLAEFHPQMTSMGYVSLDHLSISEGDAADGLEMITHDYFVHRKAADLSVN